MNARIKKYWIPALGAILLGALGSGAWEYLLLPSLVWLRDGSLTVATLGLDSFQDSLYEEIGRGFHEVHALTIISVGLGLGGGLCLGIVTGAGSVVERPTQSRERKKRRLGRLRRMLLFSTLGLMTFGLIFIARGNYINKAITHARQLQEIIAPSVSEIESAEYRSRFAQIDRREDYLGLVSDLEERVREAGIDVPEFSIW